MNHLSTRSGIFERNPKKTLTAVILAGLILILVIAEIVLRFTIPYDIGYYTAVKKAGVYVYPYGSIRINSTDFPDEEFDLSSTKPRIGYFGDSVIMGIGAGDGYRISDLLERTYPAYEHWTFGMMGNGLDSDMLLSLVERYGIDEVVYAFNLNDILPPPRANSEPTLTSDFSSGEKAVFSMRYIIQRHLDFLRGKSYLYTAIRAGARNYLQSLGFGYTGFRAAELYPRRNVDIIRRTAEKIETVRLALRRKNVSFCLLLLPYEMQISKEAAKTYHELGIRWEEGFIEGSTQQALMAYLTPDNLYDARKAFSGDTPAGTYFVFDKGDKIDFNHPNREGHAAIVKGMIHDRACSFMH